MNTAPRPDLKTLIEQEARPGDYAGGDWWQLSDDEERVFGIALERMPLLVAAWGAYEAFHGRVEGGDFDMQHQDVLDATKAMRPDLAAEHYGENGWLTFAVTFSDLTMREAWQWWLKHQAQLLRAGVMEFKDGS